jgi:hypothetical protein
MVREMGRAGKRGKGREWLTLNAPTNPNTLSIFARCRYHPKFRARQYGSSGSWLKRIEERPLMVSVARATMSVIVRDFVSPMVICEEKEISLMYFLMYSDNSEPRKSLSSKFKNPEF